MDSKKLQDIDIEKLQRYMATEHEPPLECRSDVGITVGLVDSLLTIARVLKTRDLSSRDVQHALSDLRSDDAIFALIVGAINYVHDEDYSFCAVAVEDCNGMTFAYIKESDDAPARSTRESELILLVGQVRRDCTERDAKIAKLERIAKAADRLARILQEAVECNDGLDSDVDALKAYYKAKEEM